MGMRKFYFDRFSMDENYKSIEILSFDGEIFYRTNKAVLLDNEDCTEQNIKIERSSLKQIGKFSDDGFDVNLENINEVLNLIEKQEYSFNSTALQNACMYFIERYTSNLKILNFLFAEDIFYSKFNRYGGMNYNLQRFNFVYNILSISSNNLEKLIGSLNNVTLIDNLITRRFDLGEGRKVKQLLNLPIRVINAINDKYINSLEDFQEIGKENGNDANILLDFLEKILYIDGNGRLISDFAEILKLKRFNMSVLIKYIIRQSYYSTWNVNCDNPLSEYSLKKVVGKLRDTICMFYAIQPNGNFELPIDLEFEHYVIAKNYNLIFKNSDEKEELFKEVVNAHKIFEYKNKDFSFIVPESIKELGKEGAILRHCVASYSDRIVNGTSIVLFLRSNKNIDNPFVTVEIDEDFNLLQVKTTNDMDVSDPMVYDFLDEARKDYEKRKGVS